MVDERQVNVSDYQVLAEHLPRGRSLRELAVELGRSHEYVRCECARESDALVGEVEAHLRAGRVPLFEVPPQPLTEWQAALTLAQYVVDQLRAGGWRVSARSVRVGDGVAFIVEQEEERWILAVVATVGRLCIGRVSLFVPITSP